MKAHIGLIGLAVMGENLVLNMRVKALLLLYLIGPWKK
jgi:6-phosphogluconate dehydrogenase